MDTMVLLIADSRRYEDDDCACLHNLAGVRKQVQVEGLRLHAGGNTLKTVPVNSQFRVILCQTGKFMGGIVQCFPRI
jgi:hypothetical protein